MIKVAINGFGEVGNDIFEQLQGAEGYQVIAINFIGDKENFYRFCALHYPDIYVFYESDISNLPWDALEIDCVVDTTNQKENIKKHIKAGSRHVVMVEPNKKVKCYRKKGRSK